MTILVSPILILIFLFLCALVYWRYIFFFRDPERIVPDGDNIVSPADGTVVYAKKVENGTVPISVKKKKEIRLEEILKTNVPLDTFYIVGIFMHPTSVHVNRAPISGKVRHIFYSKGRNLPMTAMWWRILFRRKPFEAYSQHIVTNERNTISIIGKIPVFLVQIADIYVSKIECWVGIGDKVLKGERVGRILMGSQVDLVFPCEKNISVVVTEGQKVKAGESVIATFAPLETR